MIGSLTRHGFRALDPTTRDVRGPFRMNGRVLATGLGSGDRFVIGHWESGPIGPMIDVMWARPDGTRVLLAPDRWVAEFVSSLYRFDDVHVVPLSYGRTGPVRHYEANTPLGPLAVSLTSAAIALPIFVPGRPLSFTGLAERPMAGLVFPGVRTRVVTYSGSTAWYQASFVQPLRRVNVTLAGASLGPMTFVRPTVGFGLGEPPWLPAITRLRTTIKDPTRSLDAQVSRWRDERTDRVLHEPDVGSGR
jgi:hypothetical protein